MEKSRYRYERKFVIRDQSFQKVENLVKMHPAVFRQTFQRRFVNNIYFDSYNYKNYFENVDGDFNRLKIRIRWYGSLFGHIKKPILELKIKNSHLGEKKSFQLPVFEINQGFVNINQKDYKLLADYKPLTTLAKPDEFENFINNLKNPIEQCKFCPEFLQGTGTKISIVNKKDSRKKNVIRFT